MLQVDPGEVKDLLIVFTAYLTVVSAFYAVFGLLLLLLL